MSADASATDRRRLLEELGFNNPGALTLNGLIDALDPSRTLPDMFEDGLPTAGGRGSDRWVVACAKRFNWPPTVTRAQTLRDLHLLFAAEDPNG